jgi:hypothetical protein
MSKSQDLTVYELERTLGIRAGVSKAPLRFRRAIEKYLGTFGEVRIGDACALVSETEEVSSPVFMAIANPGEQLLASFQRTQEDCTYWSRRKKRTSTNPLRGKDRNKYDDGESGQEEYSVLAVLDSCRVAPEVKAVTRRRKPAELLFGFAGHLMLGPGMTWRNNIRFVTFNRDWICAIQWRDADDDLSENTTGMVILGFANRRDLHRSIMLLLSSRQPVTAALFFSGHAKIYAVGKKRPPAHYLKAIEICCRIDGYSQSFNVGGYMDDDSRNEASAWAEVLQLLTEKEIREVIPRINLSDLRNCQARWMCEHGADEEDVDYSADALLATFTEKRMQPSLPLRVPSKKSRRRPAPKEELEGR